jgi:hypothetical protein
VVNLWSKAEVNVLKKLYPAGRTQEIADKIGRSLPSVRYKAFLMGIKRKRIRQEWPAGEIKLLKKLFPTTPNRQIADRLGRTMKAVRIKAFFLGLEKKDK